MNNRGLKKAVIIGAVLGGAATLGIAFSMDLFLGDALQGTWRDAAARDVTRMFGQHCGQNPAAVLGLLVLVMGGLACFGALLGAIAGLIVHQFFKVLLKL